MVSQGIVGSLAGTVIGAALSFFITNYSQRQQYKKQRRIATIQVMNNLRRWISEMTWLIDQTKLYDDSNGNETSPHTAIPDFHFETSLECVSALEDSAALQLLALIHAKDTENTSIRRSLELSVIEDDDFDLFRGRSAKLFLDAEALYKYMSLQVGWSEEGVFFDRYREMMKGEIERLGKINKSPVSISFDDAQRTAITQDLYCK